MRLAFSLVELLIAATVIAVLAGLSMAAMGAIQERSRRSVARHEVEQLAIAVETYRNSDLRHRYPLQQQLYPSPAPGAVPAAFSRNPAPGMPAGILKLLDDAGLPVRTRTDPGTAALLIDPWRAPYRYQLTRPTPVMPAGALSDWNWDAAGNRPAARNDLTGAEAPFPYIWSGGAADPSSTDATRWEYRR